MRFAQRKPATWALVSTLACLLPEAATAETPDAALAPDGGIASPASGADAVVPAPEAQGAENDSLAKWLEDLRVSETRADALDNEPIGNKEIDAIETSWRAQAEKLRNELRVMERTVDKSGALDILRDQVAVASAQQAVLVRWIAALQGELLRLDGIAARARAIEALWTPRLVRPTSAGPEGLEPTIRALLTRTKTIRQAALDRKQTVTVLFRTLSDARDELERGVDVAHASIASQRGQALFSLVGSPLRGFGDLSLAGSQEHALERLRLNGSVLRDYAVAHAPVYVFQLLVFLASVLIARRHRRRNDDVEIPAEYLPFVTSIAAHPWATGMLITGALSSWLHDSEPALQRALLTALSFVAAMRFTQRRADVLRLGGLLSLLAVDLARSLAFGQGQPARLLLDTQLVVLLVLSTRLSLHAAEPTLSTERHRSWLPKMMKAGRLLCVLSIVIDFVGFGMLAQMIGADTLRTTYVVVTLSFAYWAALGVATAATYGTTSKHIYTLDKRRRYLLAHFVTVAQLLLRIGWLVGAFNEFGLSTTMWSLALSIWRASSHFGTVQVSIGDVVSFGIVIWASTLLSRVLRAVLEDDIMSRAALPSGLTYVISTTTHYVVIFLGFWLALSAAGMDITRFTVIAGALGVGIGFGMQTLVNNFICGLILLYERPITVGDAIEVDGISGEVRRIGMRSSTVLTWTGAEVLVPNASLITNKVINYTLSNRMRRIDVAISVAYGTEAKRVLALLSDVAARDSAVLSHPAPQALFIGFGASALNFELRAWVANYSDSLTIKSGLSVSVMDALKEANIEIPFPQLDLHVRKPAEPTSLPDGADRA